jgi:hypothetical protein
MEFLLKVICEDDSLQNVLYAEYLFRLLVGSKELDNIPLISPVSYKKWWDSNQARYPNGK